MDAAVGGRRGGEVELGDDVADVRLDGVRGEVEPFGNAAVGEPFRNQSEHFALSWRELVERARLSCAIEELCCKSWVDDGLACGDTFERGDELLDVEDALLEEIARATAAAFEQLQRVVGLDGLGEPAAA